MNCKPGDLALVVRSSAGNEGKVVTCIRFLGHMPGWKGDDRWELDLALRVNAGGSSNTARDADLRPIRPGSISYEEVRDIYEAPPIPTEHKEEA